jgi:hypothetical protein
MFFFLSFIAGSLRYYGLYRALITMVFKPEEHICFYNGSILAGVTDTFALFIYIVLFIFFVVSGKCSSHKPKMRNKK